MILIIDSGSTKADWIFTDGKKNIKRNTRGMNPYFLNEKEVVRIVRSGVKGIQINRVEKVFFYGAGCSSRELNNIIVRAFKKVFSKAKVTVDHDILGAVLATCGSKEGISCIIGTGCNSVYFDGKRIHKNNYGLGYILGDEGSGSWLGKKLLTHFLYHILPSGLDKKFKRKYGLTKDDIVNKVYHSPLANSWLASFAPFLVENMKHPWVKNIVEEGFDEFIKLYVLQLPRNKKVKVHFVGSIAFLFQKQLNKVLKKHNLHRGVLIRKPIDGLVHFIGKKEFGKNSRHISKK